MNKKLIPPIELAWTRGHLASTQKIQALYDRINDTANRKLTITYSIPKPGSTFPFTFTRNGNTEHVDLVAVDIDNGYTIGNLSLADVHTAFQEAFDYYIKVFKNDASGFELVLQQLSPDYELVERHLEFNDGIQVNDPLVKAGDITLIFADFYPTMRLANAWHQYNPNGLTTIGSKTNAALTILFNTNADFRNNDDPAIFEYPQTGVNNLSLYRFSLKMLMVHEIGHLLGVSHFPYSVTSLLPSVMNGRMRGSVPFEYIFPNKLWSDYWLRATLADLYRYPLDHTIAGQGLIV